MNVFLPIPREIRGRDPRRFALRPSFNEKIRRSGTCCQRGSSIIFFDFMNAPTGSVCEMPIQKNARTVTANSRQTTIFETSYLQDYLSEL